MIYVASSWRNVFQPTVVATLHAAANQQGEQFRPYDFRKPKEHSDGFHWSEVMPSYVRGSAALVNFKEYQEALIHPRAEEGFHLDFDAMEHCDTCVLVLPCGASAHLEMGWFIGQDRRTAILCEPIVQPELMYKMVDYITDSMFDLLGWLGVKD